MQGYISAIKCPVSVNHKYQERKNNDQYQNIRKQLLSHKALHRHSSHTYFHLLHLPTHQKKKYSITMIALIPK